MVDPRVGPDSRFGILPRSRQGSIGAMLHGAMAADDEDEETAYWRSTVEKLLANGVSPTEAFDGANLLLQAYRREREKKASARPASGNDIEDPESVPVSSG